MRKVRYDCRNSSGGNKILLCGMAVLIAIFAASTAVAHRDGGISALGAGCQIVDWKDADAGSECEPRWVVSLFGQGDDRQCRKDFRVARGDVLVCGSAYGASCEAAFAAARVDAASSFTGGNGAAAVSGLVPLCDFWQEVCDAGDEATRYRAFVVYTCSAAQGYGGHHNEMRHHLDTHHWGY